MELPLKNRKAAGRALADALREYAGRDDVTVLGLPRGGVPVAAEVAGALGAELDLMLVRKLGTPGHRELAMGAIASGGKRVLNDSLVRSLRLGEQDIAKVEEAERKELGRRERAYRGERPWPELEGRCVILVDDGLATGATMRAAVAALRQNKPARVVVAVPLAPPDTVAALRSQVDDLVCLAQPQPFTAIGLWYEDFSQVSDDEVRRILQRAWREGCRARWEHFPHVADVGVRGFGPTLESAFEQAAEAMTAAVADPGTIAARRSVKVACRAPNAELLLVDWLNAVVYEMSTRKMLFGRFDVKIRGDSLEATICGEPVDTGRHAPATEIKGATLSELQVARDPDGCWRAQCIVDV